MNREELWIYGFVVNYWEPYEHASRVAKGHVAAESIKAASDAVIEYFAGKEPDFVESITIVALDGADEGIYVLEDEVRGNLLN